MHNYYATEHEWYLKCKVDNIVLLFRPYCCSMLRFDNVVLNDYYYYYYY